MVVSPLANETNMIMVNMPPVTVWLTSSTLALLAAMVVATAASRPCSSGPRAVTMTLVRGGLIGHGDLASEPGASTADSILEAVIDADQYDT